MLGIDYCGCQIMNPVEWRDQLLRKRWFPATLVRPQTAFTFDCLDTFHESSLQGKGNLYDFYHTILRITDNANLGHSFVSILFLLKIPFLIYVGVQYRYQDFHRVFRLWQNLLLYKRAGRGQDPSGIDGTPPGGAMVECPACPHPGRNLPDDWEKAGPSL